jgi:hypothetical protein
MAIPVAAAAAPTTLGIGLEAGTGGFALAVEMTGASAAATAGVACVAVVGALVVVGGLIYLACRD